MKANNEIRLAAKDAGVCLWQIADHLGYQDSNFSRLLRRELPEDMRERVMSAIAEIKMEVDE